MRDSAVHAEIETIHDRGHWEHIERFHILLKYLLIVQHENLLTEVKSLSHVSRLVIASKQENVVWVFEFQTEKENSDFWAIVTSVDVISQEKNLLRVLLRLTTF